jgi:hypothetical protein
MKAKICNKCKIEKSFNKIMANDPDNCITLCKECHKRIHSQEGCNHNDLKCKEGT